MTIGAEAGDQHLVEAEGADLANAVVVRVEEGLAIGGHSLVRGVSGARERAGCLVDAPGMLADLHRHPSGSPDGTKLAGSGDPLVLLGPAPHRARATRAVHLALVLGERH